MNDAIHWQLINATLNGDSQRLRHLLSKGAQIDFVKICQLFHLAAACGSTDSLKTLMAFRNSINLNVRDEVGCTALHKAASAGHREIIHFLVYHGADVNAQEYIHGNTPLHEAVAKGFSRSAEALCISRASPNLPNKMGLTPLHVAAKDGHKQSLRVLLHFGADVGATDMYGNTCLHTATRYARVGVVKILLSAGANLLATNRNHETALHIAAGLKRTKIARTLLSHASGGGHGSAFSSASASVIGTLRKRHSPPSSQTSPTTLSSSPSLPQTVMWMRNGNGETPLDVAVRRAGYDGGSGRSDMINLLYDRMIEAEQSSHYENGTNKSLRGFVETSGMTEATPYMSTDLIYPTTGRKKSRGIRLAFKNRKRSGLVMNRDASMSAVNPKELMPAETPRIELSENGLQSSNNTSSDRMNSSFMTEVVAAVAENAEYFSPKAKPKTRSLGHSLLRGIFKRENTNKTCFPVGAMKKSESSYVHGPWGTSKFAVNKEVVMTSNMPTSVSFSNELNKSLSSSTNTDRSSFLSNGPPTDDSRISNLLLGRFHQLPNPNQVQANPPTALISVPSPEINISQNIDRVSKPDQVSPSPQPTQTAANTTSFLRGRSANCDPLVGKQNSSERQRPKLGVRFDLNGVANANATASTSANHVPTEQRREASAKKGSTPNCNFNQKPAENVDVKTPIFEPCVQHNNLELRASELDLRKPILLDHRRRRISKTGVNGIPITPEVVAVKPVIRSYSDESLSISVRSKLNSPTKTSKSLIPDVDLGSTNGRPTSLNNEEPASGGKDRQIQLILTCTETGEDSSLQHKLSKSKSYNGPIVSVGNAPTNNENTRDVNSGLLMNPTMTHQVASASPLYMSCRNIDGKMGLSVGLTRLIPAMPTLLPTNDSH